MSLATLSQFKSWFAGEGHRISSYLQTLDEPTQDVRLQELLDEATARIYAAAQLGGYEVPIDVASAPMAAERAALLAKLCIDVALEGLAPGVALIPEGFRQARSRAQEALAGLAGTERFDAFGRLRRGGYTMELPGLTRSAP